MGEGTRIRPLRRTACLAGLLLAAPGASAWAVPVNQPPAECDRTLPQMADTTDVLGDDRTFAVTSVGDAVIAATLYLPQEATVDKPVPVVLRTHGGGGSRHSLGPSKRGLTGLLLEHGYAVMTWDSRGHGESKKDVRGQRTVRWGFNAPDAEVQDVRALIRVLGACRALRQEAPGDPVLGWVGTSNGAAIQLNTAAVEPAVDAIVPRLTWGDLARDLAPNGIPKAFNDLILDNFVQSDTQFDPMVARMRQEADAGAFSDELLAWLAPRSTTAAAATIRAPTLLLQGSVDGLFGLEGAFDLFRAIRSSGTPVKLVPHCIGHDIGDVPPKTCRSQPRLDAITLLWLDRYVKGAEVDTGPAIEWQAQDARQHSATDLPRNTVVVTRRGRRGRPLLSLPAAGATGGDTRTYAGPVGPGEPAGSWARVDLLAATPSCRSLFGQPRLRLKGTVTGAGAVVFAELLDVDSGGSRTVNANTMPIRLGAGRFSVDVALHGMAWTVGRRHSLALELTRASDMYLEPAMSGQVRISSLRVALPSTLNDQC